MINRADLLKWLEEYKKTCDKEVKNGSYENEYYSEAITDVINYIKQNYIYDFENLVGRRFANLGDLENKMQEICGLSVRCIESESEMLDDTDYMIDYEIEGNDKVYTLFYLKGRGENKYYITEV